MLHIYLVHHNHRCELSP